MSFWRKNDPINSQEYEKIVKRLIDIDARMEDLSVKYKILETNYNDLRGKFNRKLSGLKKEDEQVEEKDINNPVILPWNGATGKFS